VRRILLVFSIIALVLAGLGEGSAATLSRSLQGCEWQMGATTSGEDQAPSGNQPCPCHARHIIAGFALVPSRVDLSTSRQKPGKEPRPWPDFLLQAMPADSARLTSCSGHPVTSMPARYPAPLARTCVLRI
jgi:hypothetical protein